MRGKVWMGAGLLAVATAVLVIALSSGSSKDAAAAPDAPPAVVTPIKGTDLSQITLSADAVRRVGIRTAPVRAGAHGEVIPYAAVLYAPDGATYTYTSPRPRVFVRHPIRVLRIDGERALLSSGPPVGTQVVTVGSQELYGSEYDVEED